MVDGEVVPLERATVGVLDRGFLYGDAVFETLRTYRGEPFELSSHIERLKRSAAILRIGLPVSTFVLEREVRDVLGAAGNEESYVRVTVTRGSGDPGLDPSRATGPRRIVVVMPLTPLPAETYEVGLRTVTFASGRVASESPARGAKTANYVESILAVAAARDRGALDALVVDSGGRVVQGASSNVFFATRGRLVTPPEDAGILPGITRGVVLELAAAVGVPVELRAPLTAELGGFDEIFLTSSVRGLAPVVAVDGVEVGSGRPGPLYERLSTEFEKRVNPVE